MAATTRTPAERAKLRDAILAELPWETPADEDDHAFASVAAGVPGGLAEQVVSWLRRVQVPVIGALAVTAAILVFLQQ